MDLNAVTTNVTREHDACGIFARIEKSGVPTYKTVQMGLDALKALRHRGGFINGEGDGCGLLLDIPVSMWEARLRAVGHDIDVRKDKRFFIGHFFLDRDHAGSLQYIIQNRLEQFGVSVLSVATDNVNRAALGPLASREDPFFLQVAGLTPSEETDVLYRLTIDLETIAGVHVVSLNHHSVVYKVVGDGSTLEAYFKDFSHPDFSSSSALAHTRYSTNTGTTFKRVQPFALLGHNGEINTIARFYEEAGMTNIPVDAEFSDSQMVDSVLHNFVAEKGWSLFETAELLQPPILNEIKQMDAQLSDMYMYFRALWGPFSQGPAGMMMRYGTEAVFSVDALGLRPLWLVETGDSYVFSSEQGIVPADEWTEEPRPLAPGEKVGVSMTQAARLVPYEELQQRVLERSSQRYKFTGERKTIRFRSPYQDRTSVSQLYEDNTPMARKMAAFGWQDDHLKWMDFEIQTGAEPIKSLGYDGPLPALHKDPRLLSDFLQETVAVVTNPAIDREREIEHFSTRTLLGRRPSFSGEYPKFATRIELQSPLVFEELPSRYEIESDEIRTLAHRNGTLTYEDALTALHTNRNGTVEILIHREQGEGVEAAVERFALEALEAVQAGAQMIVLDDRLQFRRGSHIDPFLVTAAVHKSLLRSASKNGGEYLRRRTSILLRSAGLRNLHDIMTAVGLGADAVNPYLMWEIAADKGGIQALTNLYKALTKGIEKVLSTLGIHELRGYERLFGGVGLASNIADILGIPNFCSNEVSGYGYQDMEDGAKARQELYETADERTLRKLKLFQMYPRIWKAAGTVAQGELDYASYQERLSKFESDNPISLRHALRLKFPTAKVVEPKSVIVDTGIDKHKYPLVISSMSFGSQNETAYRAYAEAAYRANIVAMNGEGGEIKDILTKYPNHRGRQIASGRFGANAELCNHAYVLEIKIGQGAKPGEGGHLPGSKVTVQVANARNASPGVDLISPSNNHDIYSIEDLAQVIQELHTVNPEAKVAVKVPVVPNIGTIAVGIVKAGADVVNLSGFDGGTGAARAHALRHVGLPIEIGVKRVHEALSEAGLRDVAEVWADGGMKSGTDVMKAILLGANRVGFGTMAMVAIGCTSCRACHKDTCHVGIATQMNDMAEALEKGVKSFQPREFEAAVRHLSKFFTDIGEEVARLTAALGAQRTQDLVGRSDLLEQFTLQNSIDLTELTRVNRRFKGQGTMISYRDWVEEYGLNQVSSDVAMAAGTEGNAVSAAADATLRKVYSHSYKSKQGEDNHSLSTVYTPKRTLGTWESGAHVREKGSIGKYVLRHPFVAGNGFASYHSVGMHSAALGGAQDGVGKTAYGGKIVVLKHRTPDGRWIGGSVGKCIAYGAQHGLFLVQGNADARACIRLSGADIVFGGEAKAPVGETGASIGTRSNLKGFAFEYMTSGRAVVLGDPGPWICAGMTGGSVYLRVQRERGLTEEALRRRIAKGAKVSMQPLDDEGEADVIELLSAYQKELRRSGQLEEADKVQKLLESPGEHFRAIRPGEDITDQTIATE
ncbi:alpha-hydroxy-acid oxidizing protein [Alicyclobacillus sp. SO9]|nr:alpha-hydroxy-acid oxidizing protein [Alicyclobacillus sp. SO9]